MARKKTKTTKSKVTSKRSRTKPKLVMVYVTFANQLEAELVAKAMIELGLAACANILGTAKSIYKWNGQLKNDTEVVVIFKTVAQKEEQLRTRIKELHSYDCPALITYSALSWSKDYADWVQDQILTNE